MSATKVEHPRRDGLYRAVFPGAELRAAQGDGMPTLVGHFAVFNTPTEICSFMEGNFLERIAPGAFKKTFQESKGIKCLFQHGCDPDIGDKPLGPIETLREDETGAYYEVPLIDASYVRDDVLPGLEAGLYGASFCFEVIKEEFDEEPGVSADNPKGLPERTLLEVRVPEFGPVTFPAYEEATAGVRSITTRIAIEERGADVMDEMFGKWAGRNPERARALATSGEHRSVVTYKETPTTEEAWDGPANRANLPSPLPVETAREAFAWIDESRVDDEGNIPKDAARFVHHIVAEDGTVGDADTQACSTGIGVLNGEMQGTTIPDEDRQGVYDHLAHHLRDAGKEPAELKDRSAEPVEAEVRGEEASSALIAAGFSPESVAAALDVDALRKESSEPPAEGTPEPAEEAGNEQPEVEETSADALLGAESTHSDRSRAIGTNDLPPWREDEPRTPPWRSQED